MAMAEDDDDPVVQEVDVFLSKQLAERLYIFQYPVRPAAMSYDDVSHLSARIKPKQQKVEMEVSVNIHSPNYSKSKGEQIALNVDGSSLSASNNPRHYSSDLMDKQLLTSLPSSVPPKRYVAGIFKDGELHMTPLKGILQLRPSFSYLDMADSKGRGPSGETEAEVEEEESTEAKTVTVKFARRETEEAKARRMASYEYISKRREEEPWVHVRHHHITAPMADAERTYLFSPPATEGASFRMTQDDFLEQLIPQVTEENQQRPPMPNNVLSMSELKTMGLADQVKALMMNAKILRFNQLLALLPKVTDPTSALRAVQQVALLVQGCWLVKSEVIYPKDTCSSYSGVPAEGLCRGRDYVMWRFTQSREVVRKDISTVVKLPAEDVKDILEQMSRLKMHKGWEFMLEYDQEFVNRHPEVVQRQQMLWDAKFQQLSKTLKISKADLDRKAKSAELAASSPEKPKRRRTMSRSRTKSGSERSFSDQSDTDTDNPKERTRRLSGAERSRKNSGAERARKNSGHEHSAGSSQENLADLAPPETPVPKIKIKKEKLDGDPPAASASTSNDTTNGNPSIPGDLKTELAKFVSDRMANRYLLTLNELKIHLTRYLAGCPAGHVLATGVSDKLMEQAVYDCGAVKCATTAANGEPIFALTKVGDSETSDNIRAVMFNSFTTGTKGITYANVKEALEKGGHDYLQSEIRKIMRQYCTARGKMWVLKGT